MAVTVTTTAKANYKIRKVRVKKNIALVAHDAKKKDLLEWAKFNKERLAKHSLWATGTTGTTGKLLEKALGLNINRLKSGPLGGDQMVGFRI